MKQLMRRQRSMGAGRHGHFVPEGWHERGIYSGNRRKYSVLEQFWGRAVRASHDPRGSRGAS
jgi:hypothetical protein